MTKPFASVAVIGLGLIGVSLARALRSKAVPAPRLYGYDADPDVRRRATALGVFDTVAATPAEAVREAELTVLCVPVGACGAATAAAAPYWRPGSVVTDVGSVKVRVIADVRAQLPAHVTFVPGHPVAGTEHSGPEAGFAELFVNRRVLLTPDETVDPDVTARVATLWQSCGAVTDTMEAERHDTVFALVSHLPHLIAYTIVGTAYGFEQVSRGEVIAYAASGFRDFTRLASSDPVMWRDICLNNAPAVLNMLGRFTEDLLALQRLIRDGEGEALKERFALGREVRRRLIDAGQAGAA